MIKLNLTINPIKSSDSNLNSFIIEPLNIGQGITLGNSLKRILLSDLTGFSITGTRINNIKHEFSLIQGIREDILEIMLNLRDIIIKPSFIFLNQIKKYNNSFKKLKGYLNIKGPSIITAGLFKLPKDIISIVNPNQYICTIVDDSDLYMELDIESGKGYKLVNYDNINNNILNNTPSTLLIDANFSPIKKVNFKIKLITDSYGNIKESLIIDILTNGSITSKRALQESLKVLLNLIYPLFVQFKNII
jgi:DNA-directed RNA polymerase subunit alpha